MLWAFKESGEASRMARLFQCCEKRFHMVWKQLMGFGAGQQGWQHPRSILKTYLRFMHGSKAVLNLSVQHIPIAGLEKRDSNLEKLCKGKNL